ncbi:MAG: hypothetical protein HOW97_37880 [Catenulispora sp.]|nr:hypothetical protein [Catenulispora sp.]
MLGALVGGAGRDGGFVLGVGWLAVEEPPPAGGAGLPEVNADVFAVVVPPVVPAESLGVGDGFGSGAEPCVELADTVPEAAVDEAAAFT